MSKTSIDKMIQLNHVKFGYSDTEVLDEINLTINEGEYVVLTGENGSGKSTLMRLILGELKPDEGEIIIMKGELRNNDRNASIWIYATSIYHRNSSGSDHSTDRNHDRIKKNVHDR